MIAPFLLYVGVPLILAPIIVLFFPKESTAVFEDIVYPAVSFTAGALLLIIFIADNVFQLVN